MHFVSQTLQRSTSIVAAIPGQFSSDNVQEVVVAKVGGALELLRPDEATGKVVSVGETPTFSVIRSVAAFRLTGATRDYVVLGSDAGSVTVLEWNNGFQRVHCETFGKTGCRRAVPGQYVACDPRGRALMVGAIDKQKLVYVMNRDASSKLTISSPLEAHKASTVALAACAVDVGFENPTFAVLELDYADCDLDPTGEALEETEKMLTYYELDLGLNHVTRRWSEPVSRTAHMLVTVPGGDEGPSGVLVCGGNWIAYKHEGHAEVRAPLPRRQGFPAERGLLVTAAATHKQRDLFFFLVQTEVGDIYKTTLEVEGDLVKDVVVAVFDSIFPCSSLCITRTGLLFAAAEFGDHALFQFQGIGDESAIKSRSVNDPELGDDAASAASAAPTFVPSDRPKNLVLVDEPESMSAITDFVAADLLDVDSPQLYALCGARGARSSLRILRHGVAVAEMAVSELPGRPSAVWTVEKDEFVDRYIVVSFTNATLVLSIGDTVEEVTDSGFLASEPTLDVCRLVDGSLVQAHPTGIRHVQPSGRLISWKTPSAKNLEKASCNSRQVAVSLAGGELIYFEMDDRNALVEVGTKELGVDVACLDVGVVPPGRLRSAFLAVGGFDSSLRILSLDPSERLVQLSTMHLGARPESVRFVDDVVHAGLSNGVSQRARVDGTSGALSDARSRFLGSRAVRLFRITVRRKPALLALSSAPWLGYSATDDSWTLAPLTYEALEYGAGFRSEQCPEGVVAISGSTLRIFVADKLGETFNQTPIQLRYTPRKLMRLGKRLLILESDQHQYNEAEKQAMTTKKPKSDDDMDVVGDKPAEEDDDEAPRVTLLGPTPPSPGKWASCVRILDPSSQQTLELLELGESEAALSCGVVSFTERGGEAFVVVGTAKSLTFHPRAHQGCFIHIYRLLDFRLVLLHKTEVDDVPLALAEYRGRLLVAVGSKLRLYDLGKRKLLRKTEAKIAPNLVTRVEVMGDRIFATDALDSVFFVKYIREHNRLAVFADDAVSRATSALCVLDYDTVALADKYGNVAVLRLPADATDDVDDPAGNRLLFDTVAGAPNKLAALANFHVGDTITQLRKATLANAGAQALVYATVGGAVGALLPSVTRDDKDFYQHLEMHMRQQLTFVTGRDHIAYRGYFFPVKDVADGDLCDLFASLPLDAQKSIANDLDRSPAEVLKKLDDNKNRLL